MMLLEWAELRGFLVAVILMNNMDPSRIWIWNVRGLNFATHQHLAKDLVDSAKVDVVCLQQTKMLVIPRHLLLPMLGSKFDTNFISLPSVGASGDPCGLETCVGSYNSNNG